MTEQSQIRIYQSPDGKTQVDVRFESDTVWLTQRQMSDVFGTTPENVLMHLKNIYKDGELSESATTKDFLVVRTEGKRQVSRNLKHYNLDAIISIGYRVNSKAGVQFRIWATQRLREYLLKGYAINQKRFDQNAALLRQALSLIRNAGQLSAPAGDSGPGLPDIISHYIQTFLWLQRYDEGLLEEPPGQTGGRLLTPEDAISW